MAKKIKTNPQMQEWIDARRRRHLSDSQVQMARELGLNPVKLYFLAGDVSILSLTSEHPDARPQKA